MCKILCSKCLEVRPGTRHHLWPRRFFNGRGPILFLCRQCHNLIERLLPQNVELHPDDYLQIAREFLTPESD